MVFKKPRVVVTRKLPDTIETRMMELFDVELNLDDRPMSVSQLINAVKSANVLVPTLTDKISAEILSEAGNDLKLIANYGMGVDHIDLNLAQALNITITNTPDSLTEDTADMTMALILGVSRRLSEGINFLRSGAWNGWSPTGMLGSRIFGKRLGIVGMGRIGQAVAMRARGFGLAIHYHNRHKLHKDIEESLEATFWDSLDQMLARMDFISINCPHTPATYHLLSGRRLQLLQKHAIVVNTSRGEVIDEIALTTMLENKKIAGAGLDVFENEPAVNQKLMSMENVILLPHMGSATSEGRIDMGEKVLINIKTFVDGHNPPDRLIHEAG